MKCVLTYLEYDISKCWHRLKTPYLTVGFQRFKKKIITILIFEVVLIIKLQNYNMLT